MVKRLSGENGGRSRRVGASLLVAIGLFSSGAMAQVRSNGVPATAQITFKGVVTSAVEITVEGSIDLNGNDTTLISGSGTQGVINFGVYNLNNALLTGNKHRVNKNPKGNYLVATVRASVRFSGGPSSASIDLYRAFPVGGSGDVPLNRLFFSVMGPKNARKSTGRLSWPRWDEYPEKRLGTSVFQVPAAGYVPGPGNLESGLLTGEGIEHQLGVWIPDSQTPGPFSTVVSYTATAL